MLNTENENSTVCDPSSGQCKCKEGIGGRRCDRCTENAVGVNGTKQCTGKRSLKDVFVSYIILLLVPPFRIFYSSF